MRSRAFWLILRQDGFEKTTSISNFSVHSILATLYLGALPEFWYPVLLCASAKG